MFIKKYSRKSISFFLCVLLTLLIVSYVSYLFAFRKGLAEGKSVGIDQTLRQKLLDEKIIVPMDSGNRFPIQVQRLIKELNPSRIADNIHECNDCKVINICHDKFLDEFARTIKTVMRTFAEASLGDPQENRNWELKLDSYLAILAEEAFSEFVDLNCQRVTSTFDFQNSSRELDELGQLIDENYKTVSRFSIVMNNSLCRASALLFKGIDCDELIQSVSTPISEAMKERAMMTDVNRTVGVVKNRLRSGIVKIATIEDESDIPINHSKYSWIPFSSAHLEIVFKCKVSAGIEMPDQIQMMHNHSLRTIYLLLPPTKILSNEVDFDHIKSSPGLLTKLDPLIAAMLHDSVKVLNARIAIEDDILIEAEERILLFFEDFVQPMLQHPHGNYKLKIIRQPQEIQLPVAA